jgi:hypothetical protein
MRAQYQCVGWVEPTGRANARPMINSAIPITRWTNQPLSPAGFIPEDWASDGFRCALPILRAAIAGSARETPAGTILSGVHKVSLWSHSFGVKGNRRFFSDVEKMIKKLESHKALLAEISNGGGTIDLIIHLPGDINIGDVFLWRDMARLSALQISLGIEVFPNFD